MAVGNAVDFAWFRYTDDIGGHWSVKTDKDWGALAAAGFAAFNNADPAFPKTGRYRVRRVQLQDPVSTRITRRPIGSTGATIAVDGATVDVVVKRATGVVTLTSQGVIPERRPKKGAITSKAEPITH